MALRVDVRSVDGAVAGTIELDDAVFGIEPNVPVLHQVVTAQLAAARSGTQSTKTRSEVSGGGKKPFKQKGTGRARQGSSRAPHWTGGGVALGPKPRSYRQKTPRKMIQLALRSALSDRASEGRVAVIKEWPWTVPKTKDAMAALASLALEGRVLVVLDREDDDAARLAFRNLGDVQVILTGELNAYDVLCNEWVAFTIRNLPGAHAEVIASTPAAEATPPAPSAPLAPSTPLAPASAGDDAPAESQAGEPAPTGEPVATGIAEEDEVTE
jgi:large subunit ribosomal protein L4